jgi:hypothetical protein
MKSQNSPKKKEKNNVQTRLKFSAQATTVPTCGGSVAARSLSRSIAK